MARLAPVLEGLQSGKTLREACKAPEAAHENTIRLWCRSDEGVAQRVLTARHIGAYSLIDRIIEDQTLGPEALVAIKYIATRLIPKEIPDG